MVSRLNVRGSILEKRQLLAPGLGLPGCLPGWPVLPAFGLKAILGHAIAVNLSGAGGALGAGTNLAIHRHTKCQTAQKKKKRSFIAESMEEIKNRVQRARFWLAAGRAGLAASLYKVFNFYTEAEPIVSDLALRTRFSLLE